MDRRSLKRLDDELREYLESMVEGMGRPERRAAMAAYVTGLLLDGERKSIQPIAARLVDDASKTEIEAAIKEVRESLTSEDAADINARTDALQAAFHKVSEAMYERAQAAQAQDIPDPSENGTGNESSDDEDVVDAEVVDEGR